YPKRCAKVSAPLQLLHIEARITSADVSKRFRCRKNLQHICGLAKFPQESKLSEETSPIRASLPAILMTTRTIILLTILTTFLLGCNSTVDQQKADKQLRDNLSGEWEIIIEEENSTDDYPPPLFYFPQGMTV